MPYELFHNYCPDVAERETRTVTLTAPQNGLPADAYGMLEMYCNEPGCDCRRVFFMVVAKRYREPLAYVAYGWESRKFYARWMRSDAPRDIEILQGPILNLASPQSKYAPALLRLIDQVLLSDPAYIERLKRHYQLFRDAVEGKSVGIADRRLHAAERKRVLAAKMREVQARRSQKRRAR